MKKKIVKGLLVILFGYLLLVAVYFLYLEFGGRNAGGMFAREYSAKADVFREMAASSQEKAISNYASLQLQMPREPSLAADSVQTVEQKYEKIASVGATTTHFAADEQLTRDTIKAHHALIQEEAVNNYDSHNVLRLTIGVPPGEFDGAVADLKKVGQLEQFQITKTDKTNDFLQLKAKRLTLEKARDALTALKAMGGKIDELVKVEQEILSLEGRIQELGVQLGQFDKVNEFCTARFTLAETTVEVVRSPHLGYLVASLQWAAGVYLAWLGICCVGLVCVVLLLVIIEKSKIFRSETDPRA
jgi:hypothetical protein